MAMFLCHFLLLAMGKFGFGFIHTSVLKVHSRRCSVHDVSWRIWRLLLQPFPANLMVGCFAIADSSQVIRTDLDNELEGACFAHCLFVNMDGPDE